MHHPNAACATYVSSMNERSNVVNIMDIPLGVHTQGSWHTTLWDFTQAVIQNAMRLPLSPEDIKNTQTKAYLMSSDPGFRQRFQGLRETSTLYDVLRVG